MGLDLGLTLRNRGRRRRNRERESLSSKSDNENFKNGSKERATDCPSFVERGLGFRWNQIEFFGSEF